MFYQSALSKPRGVLLCVVALILVSIAASEAFGEMAVQLDPEGGMNGQSSGKRDTISLFDRSVIGLFVTLRLDNGDVLRGTIASVTQGELTLQHAVLGEVMIPITRIGEAYAGARPSRIEPGPAPKPGQPMPPKIDIPTAPTEPDAAAVVEGPPSPAPLEVPVVSKPRWQKEFELGLTGSQGNSERANFQAGFRMSRTTERDAFQFNSRYRLDTTEGDRTANRFLANARNEWGLSAPDWSIFMQSGLELDEFRDFDVRWTGGGGFGYRFLNTPDTTLRGRLGFGFARDFGGLDEEYNPEVITGLELSHRLNSRQQLLASAEVFPEVDDFEDFRSILKTEWQLRLENSKDIFLRIGAEHRYDTATTADDRSDLDYFVRLVFGF